MRLTSLTLALVALLVPCSAGRAADDTLRPPVATAAWQADVAYFVRLVEGRHPNPFGHVSRAHFESEAEAFAQRIPALDDEHVVMGFQRLTALIHDGHTTLPIFFHSDPRWLAQFRYHRFPIRTERFSDGWFVYAASEPYRAIVGGRIVSIGGVPIAQIVAALDPYVSRDNDYTPAARLPYYLEIPEALRGSGAVGASNPEIVVENRGARRTAQLRPQADGETIAVSMRDPAATVPLRERDPEKPFWLEYLPESRTVYVQYNVVTNAPDETFEHFCDRLVALVRERDAKRVVVDLRRNGGGSGDLNLYLLNAIARLPQIDRPGGLFVLLGRHVFSAAQLAVDGFDRRTNALFAGEPPGALPNHYGDARAVALPNSRLRVAVSTVYHQESGPFEYRDFTPPEIAATLSSDDERRGSDPALAAIDAYVAFPDYAKSAIAAADVERYLAAYRTYRAQPINAYAFLLGTNNAFARALLKAQRAGDAVRVAALGARDYPRASAFRVLAEANVAAHRSAEAIVAYRRALEIDPYNPDVLDALEALGVPRGSIPPR
jgi:hypothetical protein